MGKQPVVVSLQLVFVKQQIVIAGGRIAIAG